MPKTKEQFEEIKKQRRQEILENSLYLFAIKGYDAVTVDEISAKCKCSHGLIFHYFNNKEGLFEELMNTLVLSIYKDIIKDVNYNQIPKFVFIDMVDALLNALKSPDDKYPCTIYLLLNLYLQRNSLPKYKKDNKHKPFEKSLEAIKEGIQNGSFHNNNPKELLVAVISALKGLAFNRICLGTKFICPQTEIITRMVIK